MGFLNLTGFCAEDPQVCNLRGTIPGQPPPPAPAPLGPCPTSEHAQPCGAGETLDTLSGCCFPGPISPSQAMASTYGSAIANAIYRVMATLGCKVVCPGLPFLGAAVVLWLGIPETIIVAGLGEIEAKAIGFAVGEAVKAEVCGACQ